MHPLPKDTAVRIIENSETTTLIKAWGDSGRLVGYLADNQNCIIYFFESETTLVVPAKVVEAWLGEYEKTLLPVEFQTWLENISPLDF